MYRNIVKRSPKFGEYLHNMVKYYWVYCLIFINASDLLLKNFLGLGMVSVGTELLAPAQHELGMVHA